ncbi:hypothetical protein J7M22_08905 [Candidatus Poribacteria bacterium]|nr:hypothetical protein [Candidatus Poribacteria bacterium]
MLLKNYGYTSANIGKLHFLPCSNRDHGEPHPSYGFDHLEISDEPGCYEDAYRAWVRRVAPDQLSGLAGKARYDNILAELRHEMLKRLIQIERPIRPVWAY